MVHTKLLSTNYFAAEAFDPSKKDVVKRKVNLVFDKIETLREEAETARKQTQAALKEIRKARIQADSALQKANKLIEAFYFYDDKFALAYKDNSFYFINKNGDEITSLKKWDKAEQFEKNGFAKVKKIESGALKDFLIDTMGNEYRLAFDIKAV